MWPKIEEALVECSADWNTVRQKLGLPEILAQLGEEGAEIAQAALKLRRVNT